MSEDAETGTTITDGLQAIAIARNKAATTKSKLMVTPDMIDKGELILAASSFTLSGANLSVEAERFWPWPDVPMPKLETTIASLAKAGALLASEIDRVLKGGNITVSMPKTDDAPVPTRRRKSPFKAMPDLIPMTYLTGSGPTNLAPDVVHSILWKALVEKLTEVSAIADHLRSTGVDVGPLMATLNE